MFLMLREDAVDWITSGDITSIALVLGPLVNQQHLAIYNSLVILYVMQNSSIAATGTDGLVTIQSLAIVVDVAHE